MKKLFLAVVIGSLALSGCTIRVADMTVASSKNYNINAGKFTKGVRVIGEDRYPVVIIPFGLPNIKTAMDNAIQKDRCAVGLSDVVMSQLNHSFLFGTIGYRVEGDLIIDNTLPGCANHI
ncbi:hypothetical protein GHO42_14865 [Pseudomonas sp. FSL R10-0056]|uniref:hypothetical protein n=1 Tax=unclassified Pseudomonas TaxID=196821 RepID=UPI000E81F27B|nr:MULTISPECIES: hypothetical protein [unclassified Pseudomonas]MQT64355.1 hypothetical protein [Pseudomonas sp. FSL R10-0056]MQT69180.1 hypothetical protein [Pseudomonas sp. FSL R10-0071]MQU48735.1 hypothetical protein [Pseudomonas sp. FSL A6-1183]HBP47497.1 hypothetical protein [Pseudomonas sp.]